MLLLPCSPICFSIHPSICHKFLIYKIFQELLELKSITLFIRMDFPIHIDTISMELSVL